MATFGTFADLTPAQVELAQRRQATGGDPLSALIQGFQMPQQLANQALNEQLSRAIQQAKLQELQSGIQNVGGNLVRVNPETGEVEVKFRGGVSAASPTNFQLAGFTPTGQPLSFDPRLNALTIPTMPQGVSLTGPLQPKTLIPESQKLVGLDASGNPIQFGSRGSGLSTAPVIGTNISGPLQPMTNRPKSKQLLAKNEKTGRITNIELGAGEELPEGFKQITKEGSNFKDIQSLRKEIADNDVVKQFVDVQKSKQRIDVAMAEAQETNNFTVVDQALISSFNRLLEPDSVTMVSEYARTSADAPIINRLKASINRITEGGRLSPEERAAVTRLSERIYQTSLGNYSNTINFYEGVGQRAGFDLNDIIQPLVPGSQPPSATSSPSGSTPITIKSIRRKP